MAAKEDVTGSDFNVLLFQETTVVHGQLQALEGINSFAFCLRIEQRSDEINKVCTRPSSACVDYLINRCKASHTLQILQPLY
jgi:hypothetical protein